MSTRTKEEALKIIEDYDAKMKKEGVIKLIFIEGKERELNQDSLEGFVRDFIITNHAQQIGNSQEIKEIVNVDGTSQCKLSARRSVGDLYRIALGNYSKPTSLLEVMEAAYAVVKDKTSFPSNYHLQSFVCGTISKRVFCLYPTTPYTMEKDSSGYIGDTRNEFTITAEDYNMLFEENFNKRQQENIVSEVLEVA